MQNKTLTEDAKVRDVLKALSTSDFRSFGLRQIAYIRFVKTEKTSYYRICSADGEELMNVESLALAKVLARQEDLEPVIVQ
ncbi:MAG: hypothetical protein KAJ29_05210 [Alphaproteobacteria bacterium]|nr:hypothetical protein [Alphaproteobacteria bacterium]